MIKTCIVSVSVRVWKKRPRRRNHQLFGRLPIPHSHKSIIYYTLSLSSLSCPSHHPYNSPFDPKNEFKRSSRQPPAYITTFPPQRWTDGLHGKLQSQLNQSELTFHFLCLRQCYPWSMIDCSSSDGVLEEQWLEDQTALGGWTLRHSISMPITKINSTGGDENNRISNERTFRWKLYLTDLRMIEFDWCFPKYIRMFLTPIYWEC